MIRISELRNFSKAKIASFSSFICDIVILEPEDMGCEEQRDEDDNRRMELTDWRYFNVYIINYEPRLELNLGISDSFQINQSNCYVTGDIKANGLICFWYHSGKLKVTSRSTLTIEAFDPDDSSD